MEKNLARKDSVRSKVESSVKEVCGNRKSICTQTKEERKESFVRYKEENNVNFMK